MRLLPACTLAVLLLTASAAPPTTRPTDADYTAHLKALRQKLTQTAPDTRFTLLVQKPFIIIGDAPPDEVRRSAERTVKWAVDHLKKDFFDTDPPDILDIYLFKDKPSYDTHTRLLFNDTPSTPYGYYSPGHKALIMNIATGGGTLVHEIVHPYVAANFPGGRCPAWFNEGLGSLFEQCDEQEGHIVGLTNWRLAGLQAALRAGKVPPFKTLLSTTTAEFYNDGAGGRGTNYAQARYLLYYLQQRNLLRPYYRAFLKNHEADPTGYATLLEVLELKEADLPAFQKQWEQWILTLRFP
jgi:hypothetical protein